MKINLEICICIMFYVYITNSSGLLAIKICRQIDKTRSALCFEEHLYAIIKNDLNSCLKTDSNIHTKF